MSPGMLPISSSRPIRGFKASRCSAGATAECTSPIGATTASAMGTTASTVPPAGSIRSYMDTPCAPIVSDVAGLTDLELVAQQQSKNDWFARQSRHVLHERAVETLVGRSPRGTTHAVRNGADRVHKLRTLVVVRHRRCSRFLAHLATAAQRRTCPRLGRSALVRRKNTLSRGGASVLCNGPPRDVGPCTALSRLGAQQLSSEDRWALAEELAAHSELADDRAFPLMMWFGIEPAVAEAPSRALHLAGSSRLPRLARFLAPPERKPVRKPEARRPPRRDGQPSGCERTNGRHSYGNGRSSARRQGAEATVLDVAAGGIFRRDRRTCAAADARALRRVWGRPVARQAFQTRSRSISRSWRSPRCLANSRRGQVRQARAASRTARERPIPRPRRHPRSGDI